MYEIDILRRRKLTVGWPPVTASSVRRQAFRKYSTSPQHGGGHELKLTEVYRSTQDRELLHMLSEYSATATDVEIGCTKRGRSALGAPSFFILLPVTLTLGGVNHGRQRSSPCKIYSQPGVLVTLLLAGVEIRKNLPSASLLPLQQTTRLVCLSLRTASDVCACISVGPSRSSCEGICARELQLTRPWSI